jgi:hypothetical protein
MASSRLPRKAGEIQIFLLASRTQMDLLHQNISCLLTKRDPKPTTKILERLLWLFSSHLAVFFSDVQSRIFHFVRALLFYSAKASRLNDFIIQSAMVCSINGECRNVDGSSAQDRALRMINKVKRALVRVWTIIMGQLGQPRREKESSKNA